MANCTFVPKVALARSVMRVHSGVDVEELVAATAAATTTVASVMSFVTITTEVSIPLSTCAKR